MEYEDALKMVVEETLAQTPQDFWQTDLTEANREELKAEVLDYLLTTVSLDDPPPSGAVTYEDDGSALAAAYRVVLEHHQKR